MSGQFNFGPGDDEFDRFAREMGEGLKDMFGKFLSGGDTSSVNWAKFAESAFNSTGLTNTGRTTTKSRPEPEPTTDTDSGVWAIVITDGENVHVEQVFATEIDALRANQNATGESRRVRFLPYGIPVSAFERAPKSAETAESSPKAKAKKDKGDKKKDKPAAE